MIYPPATGPGSSGNRMRGSGAKSGGSVGGAKGVRNGRRNGKAKQQQQVVQWKQRNVQEGIVIVDEQQLSKLIKRDPIQKFYDLDPEPFATGLFASVRCCRSRDTGQQFAAKFSSRARYGEDCSAEIHHEIALLSLCSPSSRVIRLHDVFETATEVILVLEFAPGGDLQTIIDDNLVPFEADVVKFVRQLVEGLAYLHERKIAHLDIKPQNLVMMADFPDCDVKLCDFEISRVILEGTEIREILGTPDYVAPEILHYEPITMKADMWSLGVTTYVLLTGFSPFGGETDQETFCNISRAEVDFPEELFEDVSEEAQDFIKRLLVRDPGARPTAKECLRHKWLSKKIPRTPTPPSLLRQDSSLLVTKTSPRTASPADESTTRVPPRNLSQQQKNLRKYLSKSREALFERVVQQQQQHQKNSLRKTTLLSQYHKTRRLCESQMSLVSKSRERLMLMEQHQMNPYFSRSREKLYGLRSLSKSHEVLDLCKTAGVAGGQSQQGGVGLGILKTLTRATTADLSMIPLLRQRLMGHGSSTTSITSSVTTDQDLEEPIVPPSPSDQTTFPRVPSTPTSVISNTTIEEMLENSSEEPRLTFKNEPISQIPALLSPKLLKETIRNQSKFQMFSEGSDELSQLQDCEVTSNNEQNEQLHTTTLESSREDVISTETLTSTENEQRKESIDIAEKDCLSSDETLTIQSSPEPELEEKVDDYGNMETLNCDENVQTVNKTNDSPIESLINNQESFPLIERNISDSAKVVENNKNGDVIDNSEEVMEKTDEACDEELEPRYTVAQLISAFNRHQEVVTKTSLEVTMTTNDKETKMSPVFNPEGSMFPTGPNALRLFIPDIDITNEPPKRKQKRKYNLGLKFPGHTENRSDETEEMPKEAADLSKEIFQTDDEESFQSLESSSSFTTNEYDSITNLSIPEDAVGDDESSDKTKEDTTAKENESSQTQTNVEDENVDCTNNNTPCENLPDICTLVVEPPNVENEQQCEIEQSKEIEQADKFQLSVEVTPNYLRSGSLSSEASVGSSETSGSMSWEELTPPSTATPTSNKDEPQQWPQKSTTTLAPSQRHSSRSTSPSIPRESWGRICTGTYNRAMEKFNSKVSKQEINTVPTDNNRRPTRKSLTLLSPPQVINASEKVRRKSIPVIKQYS